MAAFDRKQWRQHVDAWVGRAGGAVAGTVLFGPLGTVGGALAGYAGDLVRRRWAVSGHRWRVAIPDDHHRRFVAATCAVMGCVAKADGRVSEAEIARARGVFDVLGIEAEQRPEAVALFNRGKRPDFPLAWVVWRIRRAHRRDDALLEAFLSYQIAVAYADGTPQGEQHRILRRIALRLGMTDSELREHSRGPAARGAFQEPPRSPYRVLGVAEHATAEEVRTAYRRLVSRHHPDRLQARGCSDAEIRAGASRTHAARRAYDQIRRRR